nr:hypothetical protein BaRGS_026627 [Batillaria attramentaria]
MAEPDTVSNTSSTLSSGMGDVVVVGEEPALSGGQHETDADLQEAAGRLETSLRLQPDADITTDFSQPDSDSIGAASSSSSARDHQDIDSDDSENEEGEHDDKDSDKHDKENGVAKKTDKEEKSSSETGTKPKTKDSGSSKKSKNPLKMLKKLTKFDKPKKKEHFSEFEQVRIDKLPQVFVAKYLGMREVRGFCGLHHVRKPVDEMVARVQKSLEAQEQVELPLLYVIVSPKGVDMREHKLNKQKEGVPTGLIPIDFISYGVQDIKYWRVFTFIVVRELSSRSKVTECHAYLCDSSLNARKMALSLGASFRVYARSLKKEGKYHNFQVELRPPDELAEALNKDCDA